jgi:hypothetical protein
MRDSTGLRTDLNSGRRPLQKLRGFNHATDKSNPGARSLSGESVQHYAII